MRFFKSLILVTTILTAGGLAPLAMSQPMESATPNPEETTLSGTVVSISRVTMLVKAKASYQLFVIDSETVKPASLPIGSNVSVKSVSAGEPGLRLARVDSLERDSADRAKPG